MQGLSGLLRYSQQGRRQFLRGIALRTLAQLFTVLPFFIAWLALGDLQWGGGGWSQWSWLAAGLGICLLAQLVFSHFGQLDCFLGSYALMSQYRQALAEHLRRLPLGWFQRHRVGSTSALLTDQVKRVEEIFSHMLPEVVLGLVTPLLFAMLLMLVDPWLTLALFATVIPGALLLWLMTHFLLRGACEQGQRFAIASGLLVEFVSGIKTLRLFNRHQQMLVRLDETFADIRRASMGMEAWGGGGVLLFRLLAESGLVVMFITAAALWQQDALPPATWLLFVLVGYKVISPLLDAAAWFTLLRVMRQSAAKLDALMAEPTQPEEGNGSTTQGNSVRFEKVSFAYDSQPVVSDISFTAPEGSVTALVGPSGSGKSTLLHLLGGFWSPQQGEISLGGVALAKLGARELHQRMGYVMQDVQLFDGSVLDNVRIGNPQANDEQIIEACRQAWCQEFIERLPQGYHTRLGEGAQRLSGGERQRLSIARMMLKDPAIIILDEATALLDPLSQAQVQMALSKLARGKTVLMIAHRLRTVEFASQILVLENGRIVERGTHTHLLAKGGLYARLWQAQEQERTLSEGKRDQLNVGFADAHH
ncbi:ABC transporter ATP-binding protein [Kosakonia sp. BYX6]|uniref:ABC transporter ATP-binding protein n=1 Tax=Kosakonia calanthes TaxID=3139408 RepID=A0ABZ3B1P2_9ENTR